jgi:hypothetical protein
MIILGIHLTKALGCRGIPTPKKYVITYMQPS